MEKPGVWSLESLKPNLIYYLTSTNWNNVKMFVLLCVFWLTILVCGSCLKWTDPLKKPNCKQTLKPDNRTDVCPLFKPTSSSTTLILSEGPLIWNCLVWANMNPDVQVLIWQRKKPKTCSRVWFKVHRTWIMTLTMSVKGLLCCFFFISLAKSIQITAALCLTRSDYINSLLVPVLHPTTHQRPVTS